MEPTDDDVRAELREILRRSGLSKRQLSLAMGRDTGYVQALVDPSRRSRARPTPGDLLRASDRTGIPLVELLERLWGIPVQRLADELTALGITAPQNLPLAHLSPAERAAVVDFIDYLRARGSGSTEGV